MSDKPETEVIAPGGDVLLVVGDKKKKKKLRVSSQTLSSTSPVFKAMFGPHFREGKQLSGAGLAEIPLPEDDADAMSLICHLLHSHMSSTAIDVKIRATAPLATVLALDKYHLTGVLHWQIRGIFSQWLFELGTITDTIRLASAIAAAYLLECEDAYNRATALFINNAEDGIPVLVTRQDITNIIPLQVLLVSEERRARMVDTSEDYGGDDENVRDPGLCLRCSKVGKQSRYGKCAGPSRHTVPG